MTALALAMSIVLAGLEPAERAPAMSVAAEPRVLRPGAASRARIVVEAAGPCPALSASVGRIEAVREASPGRCEAEYVPPPEPFPQLAIVSAVAGERRAWTVLELLGRGTAVARTSPGAGVTVQIAGETFGPVRADAAGVARIPVVVPPGVGEARHGERALPLHAPAPSRVHVALAVQEAPADRAADVAVHLFAVSPRGAPLAGAPLSVAVSQGEVAELVELEPGGFRARWRLPAGPAGEAVLTVRLPEDGGPEARARLRRSAGAPARIAISLPKAAAVAGQGEPVELEVRTTDAAGNPLDAPVAVTATVGEVTELAPAGPGLRRYALAVPPRIGVARTIAVAARVGAAAEQVAVDLAPGPVDRLVVEPQATSMAADGRAEVEVLVVARDRHGNPVEQEAPTLRAARGALGVPRPSASGGWTVRYRPRRVREPAVEELAATSGPLRGTAVLPLELPRHAVDVGAKLGISIPAGGNRPSPSAAGEVSWRLRADHAFGAALELGAWRFRRVDGAPGLGGIGLDGSTTVAGLLLSGTWARALGGGRLRLSAGLGYSALATRLALEGQPADTDTALAPALHATVAWSWRLWRTLPFVEARVLSQSTGSSRLLDGTLRAVSLGVGVSHGLL